MPDRALENALRKRDDLAAQINKAQQQIDDWKRELGHTDSFIAAWHTFAGSPQNEAPPITTPVRGEMSILPKSRPTRNNSKKEDVALEVRKLVEEAGHPIPRAELYSQLIVRGFIINGTDPDMVLSTMLWRAGEAAGVKRLEKGGYWLLEKDYPDAGYFPSATANLVEKLDKEGMFDDLIGGKDGPDNDII